MTRKLRPCGTQSAYRRHLYNNETPCLACREANAARMNPTGEVALRVGEVEMAEALEANPPVIEWAKDRQGIFRAVYIQDPHAERGTTPHAQPDIQVEYVECTDPELLAAGTREI
jgi:hypothetical protein